MGFAPHPRRTPTEDTKGRRRAHGAAGAARDRLRHIRLADDHEAPAR